MRRRASVFAQETIPTLGQDRYTSKAPDFNISKSSSSGKEPAQLPPSRELPTTTLPIRQPLGHVQGHVDPLLPNRYFDGGDTFAARFGSYAHMKVDNFAQCELRMQQLQEEQSWLHDRLNRVANRVEEHARYGGYGGYAGRGYMETNGYHHLGGWGGDNGWGRSESFNYMEAVRQRERQNIGLEKDRVEHNVSAQRHHGRAERSAPFNNNNNNNNNNDEDWDEAPPSNNVYRGRLEFGGDGGEGGPPGRTGPGREKMVEHNFTRKKPEEKPPAEAKPKRSRKISSFKIR